MVAEPSFVFMLSALRSNLAASAAVVEEATPRWGVCVTCDPFIFRTVFSAPLTGRMYRTVTQSGRAGLATDWCGNSRRQLFERRHRPREWTSAQQFGDFLNLPTRRV